MASYTPTAKAKAQHQDVGVLDLRPNINKSLMEVCGSFPVYLLHDSYLPRCVKVREL